MSLQLDTRQRAMLHEMGVSVWLPAEPIALESAPVATSNPTKPSMSPQSVLPEVDPSEHFSVLPRTPQPASVLPAGMTPMTWPELQQAVATCQACSMCQGRRAPVLAAPTEALLCDWMVVGEPPDELQERLSQPFAGEAGQLLDKMLRAVGTQRFPAAAPSAEALLSSPAGRAYLSNVLKCRPARVRAPVASELAACAPFLRREIALVQPKVIVTMGRFAMQLLLSEMPPDQVKLPLGKLRGRVWQFAGVPVVVTYPPDYLLVNPQEKAKAWADLQLAMTVVRSSGGAIQSDGGL